MDNKSDNDLVSELLKDNIDAFNILYRKYSKSLYKFSFKYLKSQYAADEIVQEVFIKIWEKRRELKKELSFKSYMFTIAFNQIRKYFRAKLIFDQYVKEMMGTESDFQTSQKIYYDSLFQYISSLVDKLPQKRRLIFIRSRFDGFNINDIARQLNISHKTVENQLTEALKFIRQNLKQEIF